jgi:hypothetical protein
MKFNQELMAEIGGQSRLTTLENVHIRKGHCSLHALYVKEGDTGKVVMLEMTKGKALQLDDIEPGKPPAWGYDAHESPDHSEFYVFDHNVSALHSFK